MAREFLYVDRNVDLDKLVARIEDFLNNNDFEVKIDKNTTDRWIEIQARKVGFVRTIIASRKAIHVVIDGTSNHFTVTQATGEWGKNIASTLIPIVGLVSLVSLPRNVHFIRKLWDFIQQTVGFLEDTGDGKEVKPTTQNVSKKYSRNVRPYRRAYPQYGRSNYQKLEESKNNFCENCGNTLKPTAKFCGRCGTPRA